VVARIFATAVGIRDGRDTAGFGPDERTTTLRSKGEIPGREIESLAVIEDNRDELIV
jgi:hypothetical protein